MLFRRMTDRIAARNASKARHALSAAAKPALETLETRLLMDGEFGSLVTRGVAGNDIANAAAYDRDGNGIVAGSFQNTVDFAPGGVNVFLDSAFGNGYVAKYNDAGSMIWVKQVGGEVNDVAVDKYGNVFVTGSFSGTRDFDPSAGVLNLSSNGGQDIFVAKYNASGDLQWARQVGGNFSDYGNGIGVDNKGFVYVGGSFAGTVDFNPTGGIANRTAAALTDGFVLRLTAAGGYNRVSQLAGSGSDYVNDLAVDDSGAVYATGRFNKTADFDPGAGTSIMSADASLGGNHDGFVWKIRSNGTLGFSKRFGGGLWDEGNAIAIDNVGNSYVTGKFTYEAKFANGAGGTLEAFGNSGSDAFVASYDSEGGFRWTKKIGGGENDEAGMGIAVDGGRNVYVTGYFRGWATLNPNGLYVAGSKGGTDAFMTALDTHGNFHNAVSYGGAGNDYGRAIAVDAIRGATWIGGSFQNTVDFDPKAGIHNATSAGGNDLYLLRLKRTASPLDWVFKIGGGGDSNLEGRFVDTDQDGNVFIAGVIRGVTDLDPSAGVDNSHAIGGGGDVFVAKFAPDGTYLWSRIAEHRETVVDIGDDKIDGMTVDDDGNVILVGTFVTRDAKFDFPNTNQDLWSDGEHGDAFVWKLSHNGNHVFAKRFGGDSEDAAGGVATDDSGNIYVTGTFNGIVEWTPGQTLESYVENQWIDHNTSQDVYVARYSPSGSIQWARSAGGAGTDTPSDIVVNNVNNSVYVVGTFDSDDFRADHLDYFSPMVERTGTVDSFIARYDTGNGAPDSVRQLGGNAATRATSVDVDASGSVFVGGDFTGTTDFDVSAGVQNRTSAGGTDAFVVKLLSNNVYGFSRKIGAGGNDTVTDLDVAADGNVYVTGSYENNVDFNTSSIHNAYLNGGSGSSFVWQMNNAGSFRSAHKFADGANGIAVDDNGSAHVIATYSGWGGDFDPGANTTFSMSSGFDNIVVVKFQPGTTPSTTGPVQEGTFNTGGLIRENPSPSPSRILDELYAI